MLLLQSCIQRPALQLIVLRNDIDIVIGPSHCVAHLPVHAVTINRSLYQINSTAALAFNGENRRAADDDAKNPSPFIDLSQAYPRTTVIATKPIAILNE